jgi:hypothetical protein
MSSGVLKQAYRKLRCFTLPPEQKIRGHDGLQPHDDFSGNKFEQFFFLSAVIIGVFNCRFG